jgi:hypothetical protein
MYVAINKNERRWRMVMICGNKAERNRVCQKITKSKYVFQDKTSQSHTFNADMMYCAIPLAFPLAVNGWLMIVMQYMHGWKAMVLCYVLAEPTSSTNRVTVVPLTMQAQVRVFVRHSVPFNK